MPTKTNKQNRTKTPTDKLLEQASSASQRNVLKRNKREHLHMKSIVIIIYAVSVAFSMKWVLITHIN